MVHADAVAPYGRARGALEKAPMSNEGFSRERARNILRATPGLYFKYEITWEEILASMLRWGWLEQKGDKFFLISESSTR